VTEKNKIDDIDARNEFGSWDHDLGLDGIASIDVTLSPGLSGRFMVTALPTIYQ
jgi:hypothetical protein